MSRALVHTHSQDDAAQGPILRLKLLQLPFQLLDAPCLGVDLLGWQMQAQRVESVSEVQQTCNKGVMSRLFDVLRVCGGEADTMTLSSVNCPALPTWSP